MARTKNGKAPVKVWQPFEPATLPIAAADKQLKEAGGQCWLSPKYQVVVQPLAFDRSLDGPVHLSIKRRDRQPLLDWRDLQRIKNDLCGEDREALQLFPAEDRLVDEANQFHLWVLPAGQRAPFGYPDRMVGSPESAAAVGASQREWEERPSDLDARAASDGMTYIAGWRGEVLRDSGS